MFDAYPKLFTGIPRIDSSQIFKKFKKECKVYLQWLQYDCSFWNNTLLHIYYHGLFRIFPGQLFFRIILVDRLGLVLIQINKFKKWDSFWFYMHYLLLSVKQMQPMQVLIQFFKSHALYQETIISNFLRNCDKTKSSA